MPPRRSLRSALVPLLALALALTAPGATATAGHALRGCDVAGVATVVVMLASDASACATGDCTRQVLVLTLVVGDDNEVCGEDPCNRNVIIVIVTLGDHSSPCGLSRTFDPNLDLRSA